MSLKHVLFNINCFYSTRTSDEVPPTYENLPLPDAAKANYENIQRQGNASNYETLQTQGRDNQFYETLQTQGRDNQSYETLQMQDINKEYESLQTQQRDERVYDKLERAADGN